VQPTHIEHIGIAVKSLEDSIPVFEKLLGIKCKRVEHVSDQSVNTAIFEIGINKIELLESTDSEGPIGSFIAKYGEGIHHFALAVESTDKALGQAKENGFKLIDRISRKGADGLQIGFLNPRSTKGVLIEYCSE
jgi:methylmalonyl-CoA/ethylmalonyl-CoA epimerase